MKRFTLTFFVVPVLLCIITPSFTSADNSGPSANGTFQFPLQDGIERSVVFNARIHRDGSSSGEMTFTDPGDLNDLESHPPASITASFDCLSIKDNRAVMSGAVTESNLGSVIGHRVLLVVEDDGEGINSPSQDKLTWGIYEPVNRTWIPQDGEVPDDTGWLLNWTATDFERPDDVGVPARMSEVIGCQSFSLSAYALIDVPHGQGNIQVRP